jgi:hypothetical protein
VNRFITLLISLLTIHPVWAVTPIEYFHGLVAGGDDAGYKDGSFTVARFNNISGLAFDDKGKKLYVADSSNRRIRVIDLDQDNQVRTLAGSDANGASDGPLSRATFFSPTKLAYLPGEKLAVYDDGIHSVRLIDLQGQRVSTIAKGVDALDMVYDPADDSLYFSTRGRKIQRLDMRSGQVSDVLEDNVHLPNPGALCFHQGNIYIADRNLPTVYELLPQPQRTANPVAGPLMASGDAKDVVALASSNGVLYALQKGGLLCRISSAGSSPVQFPTPWGLFFQNTDFQGDMPIFYMKDDLPVGFSASSREARKLFIAAKNSVFYLKDYHFEDRWGAMEDRYGVLTDFDYPDRKPHGTFRILVTGASRNSTSIPIPSDRSKLVDEDIQTPKVLVYSKQLELLLNTESALRNSKVHFEVLNYSHRHDDLSSRAYYDYPSLVKKYDIDLVLSLGEWPGYADYYTRPITSEGIPALSADHDYLLKPLSQRATSAVAKDLIDRCRALKIPVSEKQDYPGDSWWGLLSAGDKQIRDDLLEMAGRRLQLFQDKFGSLRTSEGKTPQFIIYYFPFKEFHEPYVESFWRDVCDRYHFRFMDLSTPYDALKDAYYPAAKGHLTAYGNQLIALLLEHDLIENKLVPF